jgi:carbon monoxide dehydrogenase subunit G
VNVLGKIEKSIEIKASPEKVWEMLAFDRQVEWDEEMQKGLKSLEFTSEVNTPEDKYKVGASANVDIKGMGAGEFDFEVSESIENEKMTFHAKKSGTARTTVTATFLLEPVEAGTKLTCIYDYEMPWGVFGKGLNKLFGRRLEERHQEKCLEKLKNILEK